MKHYLLKYALRVAVTAALMHLGGNAFCQALLVQPLVGTGVLLSSAEQQRRTTVEQLPHAGSSALIEIGNLSLGFSTGTIDVEFPLTGCGTLSLRTVQAEYHSEADYIWYGKVIGDTTCSCGDGFLLLISQDGQRYGHLSIGGEYYDIAQISANKHLLTKSDFSDFLGEECGTAGNGASGAAPPALPESVHDRNFDNCEIRVLALYNQSTVQAEGSVEAVRTRVSLAVTQTNIALKNSLVNNTRLVLAGIDSIPGLLDSLPGSMQLSQDAEQELGAIAMSPVVRAMRNNVGADMVAFVTGDDYKDANDNDIFGSAATIDLVDSLAYVLVETGHATSGRYTFAHEIAHILSCRHNFNRDPTPGIMHGHRFDDGNCRERNTIMQLISSEDSRILHYSNPQVKYAGKATGTYEREYNAQQFRLNACPVAIFRQTNNPSFWASIRGDDEGCPCEVLVLTAEVSGGLPGSYSCEWSVSTDGVNYGPVDGTGPTYAVNLPCVEDERVFVRLRVTGPGSTVTRFVSIRATYDLPSGLPCARSTGGSTGQALPNLLVYPNPASSDVTFATQTTQTGTFFVFSPMGQLMLTAPNNSGGLTVPTRGLPSGMYVCRHVDGLGASQTARFIVKH